MSALVITGADVVVPGGPERLDIVVEDGRIAALVADAAGVSGERLDASGTTILPGGVDAHTHLREPSRLDREGFFTGTSAAVAGGITTVGEMPQADPLVRDVESLLGKARGADAHSLCDVVLYAAAVGQGPEEIRALAAAGARAMKAYMCQSSPGYPRLDDAGMMDCLEVLAELDIPLIVHAENDELLQAGLARLQAAGRTDALAHAESRPPLVEVEAIARAVRFAEATGARLHVAHVSTVEGGRLVAAAAARGARVTCETCPQYLLLDLDDLARLGTWARCAPSIRSREEVEALWELVLDGTISSLGSDHSPYTTDEKEAGAANIFTAPLGLNVIEVMLPAVLGEARRRGMSLDAFARLTATAPAELIGLRPAKGAIEVGADADLALWDLDASWTIDPAQLHSKHRWTPLAGRDVRGRVRTTIRRGEVVFDRGEVLAAPGSGIVLSAASAPLLLT